MNRTRWLSEFDPAYWAEGDGPDDIEKAHDRWISARGVQGVR